MLQNQAAADAAEAVRKKRVLVVGPESWTTDDLGFIKEYLHARGVSAKTFRADEGIQFGDVTEEIANVDGVLLVLGIDQAGWCNRNSGRLSMAARQAEVRFTSIAFVAPLLAAETAQSL